MSLIISPSPVAPEHFDVGGVTLGDVVDAIPRNEAGKCDWKIRHEYDDVDADGYPVRLKVFAKIWIKMPRWTRYPRATSAEKKEWDRFYKALLDHERGHERLARTGAKVYYEKLKQTLVADLPTVHQELIDRLQEESDAYDVATDHGRNPEPGTIITIP